jgi:preprotein translocase subunit SecD
MIKPSRWKVIVVLLAVIFGVVFTLPNFLTQAQRDALPGFLPKKGLNLGLDLQGGSYILYSVDTNALRAERQTNLVEDTRTTLQDKQIRFSDLGSVGPEVSLRVTDPAQFTQALNLLRTTVSAPTAGGGREIEVNQGPNQTIRLSFSQAAFDATAARAVEQSIEIIRRRIDALGTKEPDIRRQGKDRIMVALPGESDPDRINRLVGQTAKLTFQMVDDAVSPSDIAAGLIPPGDEILPSTDNFSPSYVVKKLAVVTGEMLTGASPGFDQNTGGNDVQFRFNGVGARKFGDVTANNIGKRFAIVLDKKVISAPRIEGAIPGGQGRITGNFTTETANDLAVLLRAGALPAPLRVEQQQTVGAELGADAIRAGAISLGIGAAAIFVFIILAYGLFGVFAAIALAVNVLLIVGLMSLTQATLTFPGIAGLILTLAVAVDANVLIYERVRDEAHAGRTPMMALEHGYSRALVSIIDANITSAISAVIMFQFGSGPIRGFAWTLLIGVFTSVFTAVVITQLLIGMWFRATKPKTLPMA